MMDSFITKDGKKLRRGYTSGSCCAAAAKAAATMLLSGGAVDSVRLTTPAGVVLALEVKDVFFGGGYVSCGITKDSGDDPDVTNGMTFYARVRKTESGVSIVGGEGVGTVTKPGLDQPVGAAAINSVPRGMIAAELESVCAEYGYENGLEAVIYVPGGEEAAKKTFNPRLGIVGGLSILGTTGIIEPMSDDAVVGTIRAEMSQRKAAGKRFLLLTPGNYGAEFIERSLSLDPSRAVTVSNFIGDAIYSAAEFGFEGALLVAHIGKAVKLAAGTFNTHSRYGDGRREIFAAHAALCGAGAETVSKIFDSAVTDGMIGALNEAGLLEPTMRSIIGAIGEQLSVKAAGRIKTGVMTFSKVYGLLGSTDGSGELLEEIKKEERGE